MSGVDREAFATTATRLRTDADALVAQARDREVALDVHDSWEREHIDRLRREAQAALRAAMTLEQALADDQ